MNGALAQRVKHLPPYLFAEIDRIVQEKKQAGIDIISLGIGDPDLPPPKFILDALGEEATNPKNHGYSFTRGEPEFRETVAHWMKGRFRVNVDPETEVVALIGSKEGLANIARAFINPGDHVLVPDPAYPVYANGATLLSEGVPISMPLLEQRGFLPDLEAVSDSHAKMMFLNYPNNPTGAVTDKDFLREAVDFAIDKGTILCYDNAYSEVTFDNYVAPSILEVDGGMEAAIEFHSCSKTFNMTGDRIAFAVGSSRLIDGLIKVKSQIDSGPSKYIQRVATRGLLSYENGKQPADLKKVNATYKRRGEILVEGLRAAGLECKIPKATFYIWARCGGDSMSFSRRMIDVGVVATPGIGFGEYGEGYLRFSLTAATENVKKACDRIARIRA